MSTQLSESVRENKTIDNVAKYLSKKDDEFNTCYANHRSYILNDHGKSWTKNVADPVFNGVQSKLCDPKTAGKYISDIIEMPTRIAEIHANSTGIFSLNSPLVVLCILFLLCVLLLMLLNKKE